MLALAERPATQPDMIPGLKYPPDWHRLGELQERAYLDARVLWCLKYRLPLVQEGRR
jgi:hypothetical protein